MSLIQLLGFVTFSFVPSLHVQVSLGFLCCVNLVLVQQVGLWLIQKVEPFFLLQNMEISVLNKPDTEHYLLNKGF